jgi:uncharacterized SAM-binding protein YcdF (DUF218 family)
LSDNFKWSTIHRLETAIRISQKYPFAKIIICGREHSNFINSYLKKEDKYRFLSQNMSTNTYEDAFYLSKKIKGIFKQNIILVTSSPHQRRAFHTFIRFFSGEIYNFPSNDYANLYSPILPSGWLAQIINIYKDYKYNGKIL